MFSMERKKKEAQQQQIGSDLVKNLRKEMLIFSLANITEKRRRVKPNGNLIFCAAIFWFEGFESRHTGWSVSSGDL